MADPGKLVVCATPIGNLGDVTVRVLESLRAADVIEAEDTRVTKRLLAHYDIDTPLDSYHAHNMDARTPTVLGRVEGGETVALVSDAGTPGISDPGAHLVDACLDAGLVVEVLPGPSAILAALVASGLPTFAFYFGGFLPRKRGPRSRALAALSDLDATLLFYESPKRAAATCAALAEAFPGRPGAMARELTKVYEEVLRAPLAELAAELEGRELKGEVVLLVGPPERSAKAEIDEAPVRRAVEALVEEGMSVRDAAREVSAETGVPKNDVYRIAIEGSRD
jgi:16S rRNA (cytidine1402-2'-O)-methyltransferase